MTKNDTFDDYKPSLISWSISVLGIFVIFSLIFILDGYARGLHFNIVQNRLLEALIQSKQVSVIMNDNYFKVLPDRKIKKIEKIVKIYFSIEYDNFEEAKIVLNQAYGKGSSRVTELNALLDRLYDIKKNKKLEDTDAKITNDSVELKIKQKALNLIIKIFKKEALPKISSLKKSLYETLSKKIGNDSLNLILNSLY